jgi:hypothetical protein
MMMSRRSNGNSHQPSQIYVVVSLNATKHGTQNSSRRTSLAMLDSFPLIQCLVHSVALIADSNLFSILLANFIVLTGIVQLTASYSKNKATIK